MVFTFTSLTWKPTLEGLETPTTFKPEVADPGHGNIFNAFAAGDDYNKE
jgi:hypothetical protein